MRSACALAMVFAVSLAGCASGTRSRCQTTCAREKECADQLDLPEFEVDRAECVDHCVALEREPKQAVEVERHVKCVNDAVSCRQVLECE